MEVELAAARKTKAGEKGRSCERSVSVERGERRKPVSERNQASAAPFDPVAHDILEHGDQGWRRNGSTPAAPARTSKAKCAATSAARRRAVPAAKAAG